MYGVNYADNMKIQYNNEHTNLSSNMLTRAVELSGIWVGINQGLIQRNGTNRGKKKVYTGIFVKLR